MKKKLLAAASIAAAAFCCMPALAAPPAVPMLGWTGCYIGADTGGVWAIKDSTVTSEIETNNTVNTQHFPLGSTHLSGWAYGGQLGCDYQVNNVWVLGLRAMWDGSDVNGNNPSPAFGPYGNQFKISQFATAVATVGYLLNPTLELYGLGGFAWVRETLNWNILVPSPDRFLATGNPNSRNGYDVGVGVSWMFAPHWNLFVEYDHMGFGTKNIIMSGSGAAVGNTWFVDVRQNMDKLLVGFNFRN